LYVLQRCELLKECIWRSIL